MQSVYVLSWDRTGIPLLSLLHYSQNSQIYKILLAGFEFGDIMLCQICLGPLSWIFSLSRPLAVQTKVQQLWIDFEVISLFVTSNIMRILSPFMGTSSRQCNWSANGQYSRSFNGSSWREFGNPSRMYVAIAKYSLSEAAAGALRFPGMCSIRNFFINDLSLKVKKWCFFLYF